MGFATRVRAPISAYEELHLGNLLVHLLHELYHEIDQLMLEHLLRVPIGDEEGDVVSVYRLPPQDEEGLGALAQEAGELVHEDFLDLIGLLDPDADAHAVDARLDEDALIIVAGDDDVVEQHFRGGPGLYLGHIVTLCRL